LSSAPSRIAQLAGPATVAGHLELGHDDLADPAVDSGKSVFALEKLRLGTGNLIAISILRAFRRCRPTAEIEHGLRRLAADRQWNSDTVFGLRNSA